MGQYPTGAYPIGAYPIRGYPGGGYPVGPCEVIPWENVLEKIILFDVVTGEIILLCIDSNSVHTLPSPSINSSLYGHRLDSMRVHSPRRPCLALP